MSLTTAEEAQVRELLAQEAAILALAAEEPAIISSLGATDVSLSDLTAATVLNDSDLLLVRQGTTDKSISGALTKAQPDATTTTKGIIEIATNAEVQAGTDSARAVVTSALFAAMASIMTYFGFSVSLGANGYIKLPSILGGLIIQWGVINNPVNYTANSVITFGFPVTFPNGVLNIVSTNWGNNLSFPLNQFSYNSTAQGRMTFNMSNAVAGGMAAAWLAVGY